MKMEINASWEIITKADDDDNDDVVTCELQIRPSWEVIIKSWSWEQKWRKFFTKQEFHPSALSLCSGFLKSYFTGTFKIFSENAEYVDRNFAFSQWGS